MQITSLQNSLVKDMVRLKVSARQRRREGLMLVEGIDEIQLALAAGHRPRTVVSAEAYAREPLTAFEGEIIAVSQHVFDKLSYREKPDGWLAVFDAPVTSLEGIGMGATPLLMLLEAIEKPGNLGAILRSADAAGVDGVLVCDAQADIYGPNVVRSSRGTVFSVPMAQAEPDQALDYLRQKGMKVVAATPSAALDYTAVDYRVPVALAFGTESDGLSQFWLDQADVRVRIPMRGKVNSLNVSVAAALLMFEARRQRSLTAGAQT